MAYRARPNSTPRPTPTSGKSAAKPAAAAGDGTSVTKRLQQELMALMMCEDKSISAFPDGDNIMKWVGTIKAPEGTVFEGLTFKLSLEFQSNYPFSAPRVRFVSPCFHPNVSDAGDICLDILKEKWSALYDVRTILLSIQSLLNEPNNASPLNGNAARMWSDPVRYRQHILSLHAGEL